MAVKNESCSFMIHRIILFLCFSFLFAVSLLAQDYQKGVVIVANVTGSATVTLGAGRPAK